MEKISFEPKEVKSFSRLMRYFSMVTIVTTLLYISFCPLSKGDNSPIPVEFLHLLSVAAHFGAQFWVTFIAGFTLFFNLPRIIFGRVQSLLFPLYFALTLCLSCVTLVTYAIRHPYDVMTSTELQQYALLGTCVLTTSINSIILAPKIVVAMVRVLQFEKDAGVAYQVGYGYRAELRKDPVYWEWYRQFRLIHTVSGGANLLALGCNVMYIYHLSLG